MLLRVKSLVKTFGMSATEICNMSGFAFSPLSYFKENDASECLGKKTPSGRGKSRKVSLPQLSVALRLQSGSKGCLVSHLRHFPHEPNDCCGRVGISPIRNQFPNLSALATCHQQFSRCCLASHHRTACTWGGRFESLGWQKQTVPMPNLLFYFFRKRREVFILWIDSSVIFMRIQHTSHLSLAMFSEAPQLEHMHRAGSKRS